MAEAVDEKMYQFCIKTSVFRASDWERGDALRALGMYAVTKGFEANLELPNTIRISHVGDRQASARVYQSATEVFGHATEFGLVVEFFQIEIGADAILKGEVPVNIKK